MRDLAPLIRLAEVLKERDLANLAKLERQRRAIQSARQSIAETAESHRKEALHQLDWPGVGTRWLDHLRRKEAELQADLMGVTARARALQAKARLSFGRAAAIKKIDALRDTRKPR